MALSALPAVADAAKFVTTTPAPELALPWNFEAEKLLLTCFRAAEIICNVPEEVARASLRAVTVQGEIEGLPSGKPNTTYAASALIEC